MKIQIISLFPDMFTAVLGTSMLWKASDRGIVAYSSINLRDYGLGPRKQVDDTPYGGGDGMLMMCEPLLAAIQYAKSQDPDARVLLPTPRGRAYRQSDAKRLAADKKGLIIICPRYEGYDERITTWVDEQLLHRQLRINGRRVAGHGYYRFRGPVTAGSVGRRNICRN